MPRRAPVLGYPSRSAACVLLRAEGLSNIEILARFAEAGEAITSQQISTLVHDQRLRGSSRRLPEIVIARLAPSAQARGVSAVELAEELLAVIARDDMVDAVLDDQTAPSNHKEV